MKEFKEVVRNRCVKCNGKYNLRGDKVACESCAHIAEVEKYGRVSIDDMLSALNSVGDASASRYCGHILFNLDKDGKYSNLFVEVDDHGLMIFENEIPYWVAMMELEIDFFESGSVPDRVITGTSLYAGYDRFEVNPR